MISNTLRHTTTTKKYKDKKKGRGNDNRFLAPGDRNSFVMVEFVKRSGETRCMDLKPPSSLTLFFDFHIFLLIHLQGMTHENKILTNNRIAE